MEKNVTVAATWMGLLFMGLWPEVWLLTQSYYTATHWANVSSRSALLLCSADLVIRSGCALQEQHHGRTRLALFGLLTVVS